jgi:hypothetical protein
MSMTVHQPQNPFWDQGGQKVINGGFEINGGYDTSSAPPWIMTGWVTVDQSHGYPVQSGLWAIGGYGSTNSLAQSLWQPVPVARITAIGFWDAPNGVSSNVTVTLTYTDGTASQGVYPNGSDGYTYKDLSSILTAGKVLANISIVGTTSGGTALIDDATVQASASPNSCKLVYVPQTW